MRESLTVPRKPLSKRLRFEVFKRDGFRCVYCGATPQDCALHVDHVVACANGGTGDPSNLVTACQACNGGKSAVPLNQRRAGGTLDPERASEHAAQIRAYLKAQKDLIGARTELLGSVRSVWEEFYPEGNTPSDLGIFRHALQDFSLDDVQAWVRRACLATPTSLQAIRYFCGILRNARKGTPAPQREQAPAPAPESPRPCPTTRDHILGAFEEHHRLSPIASGCHFVEAGRHLWELQEKGSRRLWVPVSCRIAFDACQWVRCGHCGHPNNACICEKFGG